MPDVGVLIRKLEAIAELSPEDRAAVSALPVSIKDIQADQDIVRDGDRPSQCFLVLEGFFARQKVLSNGRRQILSFHIPGDIPDLLSLHLEVMDHSVASVVPSKVAYIPHTALRAVIGSHPAVGEALWRDTLIDGAVFREWMTGIGRRSAYTRIAHLFCEVVVRMAAVDLADGRGVRLPVTQAEIGDSLGLSTVHVNRVLQELRREGLISLRGSKLIVKDWGGLKRAGDFDPSYLHLRTRDPLAS
jgi:CRP-like cAMP-binding protein